MTGIILMIKLILVDWGDVCGLYDLEVFNTFLRTLGYDSSLVEVHFKEFKSQFDRDQLTEEEFWSKLAQKLGFKGHWSILAQNNKKNLVVNWPLMDYIKELKKRVKVALLSNMDKTSIEAIRSEVKLSEYFDKVYFSSEHKTGKLEKGVVDKIISDFKVKPEEMLFIDDFPGNIEKAKNYGMQTALFISIDDLKQKFSGKLF